jgi:exodeoxyribonuclease-3
MRIATWNVNSLKIRLPRVEEWIGYAEPDILCLQETKLADATFPHMAFAALGYETAHHGDGRWNGVAIVSRVGIDDVVAGFAEGLEADPDTRLITATCGGVRVCSVYVPNGRSLDDPHYQYKLSWMQRLRQHLEQVADPSDPVVVCGDFNIAPEDRDVWSPAAFVGSTHVSPPEREALAHLEQWGLEDAFRLRYDQDRLYTYWDYRAGDFHEHRGMRIDLVLVTKPLAEHVTWAIVDRNARKGKLPSDHAPLVVDMDWVAGT